MSGTDIGYAATRRGPEPAERRAALCCYAMFGTDVALCCYAMPSTDITLCCYAMFGTDIAYAATRYSRGTARSVAYLPTRICKAIPVLPKRHGTVLGPVLIRGYDATGVSTRVCIAIPVLKRRYDATIGPGL
eukprot:2970932-Rhodomonas_salina.2